MQQEIKKLLHNEIQKQINHLFNRRFNFVFKVTISNQNTYTHKTLNSTLDPTGIKSKVLSSHSRVSFNWEVNGWNLTKLQF